MTSLPLPAQLVVPKAQSLVAIEVKSKRVRETSTGMAEFSKLFNPTRKLLVGSDGIPLSKFLAKPVPYWVRE